MWSQLQGYLGDGEWWMLWWMNLVVPLPRLPVVLDKNNGIRRLFIKKKMHFPDAFEKCKTLLSNRWKCSFNFVVLPNSMFTLILTSESFSSLLVKSYHFLYSGLAVHCFIVRLKNLLISELRWTRHPAEPLKFNLVGDYVVANLMQRGCGSPLKELILRMRGFDPSASCARERETSDFQNADCAALIQITPRPWCADLEVQSFCILKY